MREWCHCRFPATVVVAAAMALIALAPAGALAVDGSGSRSASAEIVAESPSGPTEPASPATTEAAPPVVSAPASTGWVPQGTGTEASSDGSAPTRRGTSLGSGAGPTPVRSSAEEPLPTTSSSGYYEPESSTQPAFEAPVSPARAKSAIGSVEAPPAPPATSGDRVGAVGAATRVALPESPLSGDAASAPPASAAVALGASPRDQAYSGSGGLSSLALLIIIACCLALFYVVREEFHGREPSPRGLVLGLSRAGQRGRRATPARRSVGSRWSQMHLGGLRRSNGRDFIGSRRRRPRWHVDARRRVGAVAGSKPAPNSSDAH
jgi:hypothetical protein